MATFVVTPLVTDAVLVWVVCPVSETVMVYEPTGIQFVVNMPVLPVVAATVVATTPPFTVIVAPETAAPVELVTLMAIFPAVAMARFSVVVTPEVTEAANVLGRYPAVEAVMFWVPAVTLLSV
jgi:hypothetical protein